MRVQPIIDVSPIPGSVYHSKQTNIIVRTRELLNPSVVEDMVLAATGSTSGMHAGTLILSDDGRTLLFNPIQPFVFGEVVRVRFETDIRDIAENVYAPLSYRFAAAPSRESQRRVTGFELEQAENSAGAVDATPLTTSEIIKEVPQIQVTVSDNPTVTEVRPNGQKAFEMKFPTGVCRYRAYRFSMNLSSIADENPAVPATYSLAQNFPNPFNPGTSISFSLTSSAYTSLEVFNILGQRVETLVAKTLSAGTHSVEWNAQDQPSGVYFYRLQAGESTATKKLLLRS